MKALKILRTILSEAEISVEEREELMEAISELEAPKTCETCKLFRSRDKACFKSSVNFYIRPASIHFSGCGEYEPKESL